MGSKTFMNVTQRTPQERITLEKKPPQSVVDNLSSYPYHSQKRQEKQWVVDNTRGKPFKTGGEESQKDFQCYIGRHPNYFSFPEVAQGSRQSMAQLEQEQRAKQTREE